MRASGPDAVRQLTKFARGLGEPPRGPHSSSLARTGRICRLKHVTIKTILPQPRGRGAPHLKRSS
eukprot:scaffold142431_cov232-Phaeocystis_antarctica.AAC.1